MTKPKDILEAAQRAPAKDSLEAHLPTIETLRGKGYTWREIAAFLTEHGVQTDHSKVFRLATKREQLESAPTAFRVPPADEFVTALEVLDKAHRIPASAKAMLAHHFHAHNRTVTYTALARAAAEAEGGNPSKVTHRAANMTYGKLGRALGEELGMVFLPNASGTGPFFSSSVGMGSPVTPAGGEFELVMHHELAKALDRLGWFKSGTNQTNSEV